MKDKSLKGRRNSRKCEIPHHDDQKAIKKENCISIIYNLKHLFRISIPKPSKSIYACK
jgi:hypothetical protein